MSVPSGTRLLIAAGEAAAEAEELPPLVRALIETASEILVMSPVLVDRLRWLTSDTDRARYEADGRLAVVLGQVETLAPEAKAWTLTGDETPLTNLYLTMLEKAGVPVEKLGDSTGRFNRLEV